MRNTFKRIISYTVVIAVLIGVQSFINPNPVPNSMAQSSIVYITSCPTAYAMYVNIVGADDEPPFGMSMEDDLFEYSISGTETFISDHDIKYYCDANTYPTAYIWIKITSSSSWSYVGAMDPYMDDVTHVISSERLTSMTMDYYDFDQPKLP